jgi:hypothetical protein
MFAAFDAPVFTVTQSKPLLTSSAASVDLEETILFFTAASVV